MGHDHPVIHHSTAGRLLVATPPLVDPNFDRTVVYMIEHNDQGALGVVINRPTSQDELPGLDAWVTASAPPAVVFHGGPVEPDALIGLAWNPTASVNDGWVALRNGVGRLFRGYSGWAPWQLDGELEAGAWIVLDAEAGDPFSPTPDDLWRQVLRRQGGRLAWVAEAPNDLSAN